MISFYSDIQGINSSIYGYNLLECRMQECRAAINKSRLKCYLPFSSINICSVIAVRLDTYSEQLILYSHIIEY